eukprot:1162031-Pelagomonas_calceolata.AAC.2
MSCRHAGGHMSGWPGMGEQQDCRKFKFMSSRSGRHTSRVWVDRLTVKKRRGTPWWAQYLHCI